MAKKTKQGKNRLDKYYHLAKEQGFRSRAAFKLIQLNRKFNFLAKSRTLLDLCAAPGGWLQVASKTMAVGSLILGVDLAPIKPVRGVKTIVQDITTAACRAAIKREAGGAKMDVVLHDGAPNVGGAWASEAYSQSTLVLDSLKLAVDTLAPKGTFITKIFRSKDYNALLYAFNQLFDKVEATKPAASRNASAEIFVVCMGYKAPAKIDPRLLDQKFLFQDMVEPKKVMGPEALLRQKIKQRRFREGYEEGFSTSRRETSALAFLISDAPVEMLGNFTELALEGPHSWANTEGLGEGAAEPKELAAKIRSHEATNSEIRTLCKDLQVLGRSEFKLLLRWRLALRKSLKADLAAADEDGSAKPGHKKAKGAAGEGAAKAGAEADPAADPEELLLADMKALKDKLAREAKRDKKKRRDMKVKSKLRAAQVAQSEGIADDPHQGGPEQLFNLKVAHSGHGDVGAPDDDLMDLMDAGSSEDEEPTYAGEGYGQDSDADSDLEYEMDLDEALEHSYKEYLQRKGVREDAEKERRKRLGMDGELDEGEEEEQQSADSEEEEEVERLVDGGRGDQGKAGAAKKGSSLLVTLDEDRAGVAKSGSAMAAQWFKQDLFADPNLLDDDGEGAEEAAPAAARPAKKARLDSVAAGTSGSKRKARDDDEDGGEEDEPEQATLARARSGLGASPSQQQPASGRGRRGAPDFEVVPQEESGSGSDSGTDSEDEFDMLDDHGKAEVLALAKRCLRRKEKESIVDAAYNRFAFHDVGLPRWFAEDERRFMRPIPQVTKAEVEEEKARLRAIDARPIKKVEEAKARKKQKLGKRLDQAKQKANVVADQEDVPMKSKMKEIEKIYARAHSGMKKASKRAARKRGPPLDNRMRKDKKSQVRAMQKSKKGGGRRK
ncbi:AdoMet-dependent rRNA methyltransferase spb1 [Tetrabaena socialis]|uniref:Putative rRNA methyltransferase n=1 Tax=Tetrabaena socialis TaxID=47790 RepID=A0A2J8AJQ9_9CHLO|nr:AdoMet-dependent rRNA methyltransferase spb1 [Tetrabaena socialis]|eukprot:PNH12762.1 AdoMet-dependent rRNA methyltransferase spb1 [Tetrabaena socialis]